MNRRTLIIIATILILSGVGVGAYFYVKQKPATPGASPFFGNYEATPGVTDTSTEMGAPAEEEQPTPAQKTQPRLYELHKTPVGGVTFFETGKGTSLALTARYIERALGHIYETPLASLVESRISGETNTRISEALWGNKGTSVVIRSFDDQERTIKSKIINVSSSNTEEVILPDHIPFLSVAEDDSDKVFYLENSLAASRGTMTSFKNAGARQVFNSTVTEWLPQFPNKNLVTLTTRPSGAIPGHLFFVDPTTKSMTKVIGDINGLTTLASRDGKMVLYAETRERAPELFLYDVAKKESHLLGLQTLPEKCAWGKKNPLTIYCAVPQTIPSALYPDQWYQGVVSFSDDLWKIDGKTLAMQKILSSNTDTAPAIDATGLMVSSNDEYILFVNKSTGTPWMFRVASEAPLLQTQTIKSEPVPTAGTQTANTARALPVTQGEGMVKIR